MATVYTVEVNVTMNGDYALEEVRHLVQAKLDGTPGLPSLHEIDDIHIRCDLASMTKDTK